MVREKAQTFTLEGITAAILLLIVTYTLFQSSLVMSPMWNEFSDAQLKQLAYDTLRVLDGDKLYNDSLKGMLIRLNSSFKPNDEFVTSLEKLIKPANYRVEVRWVNKTTGRVESRALIDNRPTPEAVAASRIVVLTNGDFNSTSPFYDASLPDHAPIAVEVRLIVWTA